MHLVYLIGKIYPFFGLSVAVICGQLGLFFLRKHNRIHMVFWFFATVLVLTSILWVVFRGDIHSEAWVRDWFNDRRSSIQS